MVNLTHEPRFNYKGLHVCLVTMFFYGLLAIQYKDGNINYCYLLPCISFSSNNPAKHYKIFINRNYLMVISVRIIFLLEICDILTRGRTLVIKRYEEQLYVVFVCSVLDAKEFSII